MDLQSRIREISKREKENYVDVRRHLHCNPELSYEEFETSKFIQQKLSALDIPFQVMAGTGVVGLIRGNNPESRVVALRADMDALPIDEVAGRNYGSCKPGIMHACGHDVHTTCLLGAAQILAETKDAWEGTVKLIFQPGEEKNPGGASLLINEGVLENPAPQKIFALHVHPGLSVGEFSFRSGMVMASADEIYITIKGKGGHAAAPQFTADTILVASHIVLALQQIAARNNNPFNPTVLSITSIQGGNTTNVIPSEVKMMGTLRAMNEDWRYHAHDLIKKIVAETAATFGAEAEARIDIGYPFVKNDEALSAAARKLAETFAGASKVSETELRMGAEDFAFYSQRIPACFFRLGAGNPAKGITSNVHTPAFDVDEDCIAEGMGMMAWLGAKG